jgi:broad specificity phosphatase PhoE
MLFHCLRHGQTEFNASGRIQGQLDSPLSELGYRQCVAAAEALAEESIDAIYASPLRRAADSARAIADRLKLEVQFDDRLMEINAGMFQGHNWSDIEQLHPDEARLWRTQDPDYRIPGGESRRDVMDRVQAAFLAIRTAEHQQVVVVAHGGSLSAAFKALLEIPARRNPFNLQNGSLSRLMWTTNGDVKLLSLNEVDHLHGVEGSGGEL